MRFFYLFLVVLFLPLVSANFLVSGNTDLGVYRDQTSFFNLTLFNNNSFDVFNVSFGNLSGFVFPLVDSIPSMGNRTVFFSVHPVDTFDSVFVSGVSFFYVVDGVVLPKNVSVNVTGSGFVPYNLSVFVGDGVFWNNLLGDVVELRDLGSGFSGFSVDPGMSVFRVYGVPANFTFYEYPLGFVGGLSVLPRGGVLGHDSGLDVPLVFHVVSVLSPGSVDFSVVPMNFSGVVNQSFGGVVSLVNGGVRVVNVSLGGRWINFSENFFDLDPYESRFVFFNLTPVVDRTNDTNVTHLVSLCLNSSNGGGSCRDLGVFLSYYDFDHVVINGTTYLINRLSVNDTIGFCKAHPEDYECQGLVGAFTVNQTVIREVPATQRLTEDDLLSIRDSAGGVGDVAQRLENKMNAYIDFQDGVNRNVSVATGKIDDIYYIMQSWTDSYEDKLRRGKAFFIFLLVIALVWLILVIVSKVLSAREEYILRVKALQE